MSLSSQVVRVIEKTENILSSRRWIAWLLLALVISTSIAIGVYIRGAAWPRWVSINKVYIDAFDPWIEYWLAEYLYKHGIYSWWSLKPPNPAVMKFWYPWGRDFTRTAYPLVPALIALTYPLVSGFMTFQQWAAWLPPLAAGLLIIVASIYLYRRFGLLAGATIAFLLALLPASMDRTMLGFIEKEGITLFLVVLSIALLSESLEKLDKPMVSWVYAFLAGLAAALVGLGWGGFPFVVATMALTIILLPAARRDVRLEYVSIPLLFDLGVLPAFVLGKWGLTSKLILLLMLAPIAFTIVLWLIREYRVPVVYGIVEQLLRRPIAYLVLVAVFVLIAGMAAVYAGLVGGRIAFLLLPGALKNIVVKRMGPLVESVAEHVVDINRVVQEASITVLLFAFFGILYMVYRVVYRGDLAILPLLVASSIGYYGLFNAAYLLQTGSVFAALAAASLTGIAGESRVVVERGRRRSVYTEWGPVAKVGALVIALLLVSSAAALAYSNMPYYSTRLPLVLTSSVTVNIYSPAWYNFLVYIRDHTKPTDIFVSWWDYGYWLSVVGNRASLADGATMNATQIHLLAQILVGDYHKAIELMRVLKCRPNETYIVAFGVYWLIKSGNVVYAAINPAQADIAKSYWMVRIGGFNVSDYFAPITVRTTTGQILRINTLNIYSKHVQNALLYRLLFQAPLMLGEHDVVKLVDPGIAEFIGNRTIIPSIGVVAANGLQIVPLSGSALTLLTVPPGFKHAIVSATPIAKTGNLMLVVIVAAFEWGTTSS